MLNCHAKKMNWKDQAFLEKFFVIESSTLTGWEHFWATRFFVMWGWGLHPHQSKNSKISYHQKLPLLPPPPPSTPLHASLMILCIWQNGSASRRCPLLWKLRKTLSWCKTIRLNREFECPFSKKVSFLAIIRCCTNFSDLALACCRFNIENYFWNTQVCLALFMPNHMQKVNFRTKSILINFTPMFTLTHWITLGTSDHTQLKWRNQFFPSIDF